MRLLLLNPNTTATLTERLAAAACKVLPPDVELQTVYARPDSGAEGALKFICSRLPGARTVHR